MQYRVLIRITRMKDQENIKRLLNEIRHFALTELLERPVFLHIHFCFLPFL